MQDAGSMTSVENGYSLFQFLQKDHLQGYDRVISMTPPSRLGIPVAASRTFDAFFDSARGALERHPLTLG